jgi:outer membrane immunogenic protein
MKKLLLAGISFAALLAGPATAADLARPAYVPPAPVVYAPIFSWTGFYVGASAGYGWGRDGTITPTATGTTQGAFLDAPAILAAQLGTIVPAGSNPKGGLAGIQAGYNYQFNNLVVGLEADYSWAHISGSGTSVALLPVNFPYGFPVSITTNTTGSQNLKSFGTVRGRFGIAFDRALFYGTGGLAYGQTSSDFAIAQVMTAPVPPDTFNASVGSASQTRVGWTVGAGGEYAFTQNLTAKAEYLYYDLGNISYFNSPITGTTPGGGATFSTVNVASSTSFRGSIVRFGLNYKFGGGYGAVPAVFK